jgi:hypothetical protein
LGGKGYEWDHPRHPLQTSPDITFGVDQIVRAISRSSLPPNLLRGYSLRYLTSKPKELKEDFEAAIRKSKNTDPAKFLDELRDHCARRPGWFAPVEESRAWLTQLEAFVKPVYMELRAMGYAHRELIE